MLCYSKTRTQINNLVLIGRSELDIMLLGIINPIYMEMMYVILDIIQDNKTVLINSNKRPGIKYCWLNCKQKPNLKSKILRLSRIS